MTRGEVALLTCGACAPLGIYVAQPILPLLAEGFGVAPGRAGLAVAAPTAALALVAPLVGSLSDRFGRKPVIVAALALITVPTLLAAAASTLGALLLWQLAMGAITPAISAVSLAYVGDEYPPERAARLTALFISANVAGGFLGRYASALAADAHGWRAAFVAVAALQAVGGLCAALLLPRSRNFEPSRTLGTALGRLARHARDPALLGTFGAGFAVLFCIVGVYAYLGFRLTGPGYGWSIARVGSLYLLYGLSILLNPVAGALVARHGPGRVFAAAALAGIAGLALTTARPLPLIVGGLAVFTVAAFACQSAATNNVLRRAAQARSAASGLYMSAYYAGGALGAVLPGPVWSRYGWGATALLFMAALAAAALASLRFWGRSPPAVPADASAPIGPAPDPRANAVPAVSRRTIDP